MWSKLDYLGLFVEYWENHNYAFFLKIILLWFMVFYKNFGIGISVLQYNCMLTYHYVAFNSILLF